MRSRGARFAFALAIALSLAETASAAPVSGTITRGAGGDEVFVDVRNDGTSPAVALDIDLPTGTTVLEPALVSGASGSCQASPSQPNRVECMFDPPDGWPPGATIRIHLRTSPRLVDNAGAMAYSCSIPCNPSMKDGPFALTGPAPASAADLFLEPSSLTRVPNRNVPGDTRDIFEAGARDVIFRPLLTVGNAGPDTARGVTVEATAVQLPEGSALYDLGGLGIQDIDLLGDTIRGSHEDIAVADGDKFYVHPSIALKRAGTVRIDVRAAAATPDPGPRQNDLTIAFDFASLPDVFRLNYTFGRGNLASASASGVKIRGRAKGAVRVDVAVARRSRSARAAAIRCAWMRNARVRFPRKPGDCNQPNWLRARGTKRWTLRLRRSLPRGRYVVLARATHRYGAEEATFTRRDGNLLNLRVR
jgi:hypothetical protein